MRTRLELENGVSLGLSDEISYSITYSIADIREPDKRNGSYSKTITIPASKEADTFFKGAFDIDSYDNYNTNKKANCTLFVDDFEQIIGTIQLLKINITDNSIYYEVALKGNISNLFLDAGDKYLTDIDFSDLDHSFNKATQIATWTAPIGIGYVYPMIDYGYTNAHEFDVNNFYPAIYVKEYIDRIFNYLGYQYSSEFFNTDFFKRLIVPNCSEKLFFNLGETEQENRTLLAINSPYSSIKNYPNSSYPFPNIDDSTNYIFINSAYSDYYNQLNTTTHKITIAKSGQYSFNFYNSFSVSSPSPTNGLATLYIQLRRKRNGITSTIAGDWYYGGIGGGILDGGTGSINFTSNALGLLEGDELWIGTSGIAIFNDEAVQVNFNSCVCSLVALNIGVFDGNDIEGNSFVAPKVKIKDFLKWIIQAFNLYIDIDKQNEKILLIEPRNDFYNNGITIDWTNKLVVDKQLTITPMGQLNAVRYLYSYKTDNDYWSKKYFDKWGETFGTENYLIDNDFLKNENKTEIGFTNTISAQIDGTDRVIPQIVTVESTESGNDIKPFKKTNIRLLYFAGVKETTTSWKYTSFVSGDSDETTYAYAGHLDDVVTPTIDLSFGVPNEVYYIATAYTNNNLFNRFHKKFLEEITDKDSKIVTCYLSLNAYDIATLDFRNQFYIDGHLLRLNKIMDYNPLSSEPTKCEFIKIKDANNFVPTTIAIPRININESPYL